MRYLIITKCRGEEKLSHTNEHEKLDEIKHISLPNEKIANEIMLDLSFIEYIGKHGYHFTDNMSIYASNIMLNRNGIKHSWTPLQILQELLVNGFADIGSNTLGDITYLANMAYADFYPNLLNNELACIKYAYAVAHDIDGYEGMIFSRWLSDVIGKHIIDIDWANFN